MSVACRALFVDQRAMPLTMPTERIAEAERLIDLARTLLNRPQEEIVVNYLDHAVEALQIVCERDAEENEVNSAALAFTAPAMVQAADRG